MVGFCPLLLQVSEDFDDDDDDGCDGDDGGSDDGCDLEGLAPTPKHCKLAREEALKKSRASGCCLLYTSPSPRDATLSRMPSSA